MLKRFGFSGSSKQDANASRPGKLGQLWAAKHGFQKDGSPAPGAKVCVWLPAPKFAPSLSLSLSLLLLLQRPPPQPPHCGALEPQLW
jgi:hypothetical protein